MSGPSWVHAARPLPAASMTMRGLSAFLAPSLMVWAALHPLPGEKIALEIALDWRHTASARPLGSIASAGSVADDMSSEIFVGADQSAPLVMRAAQMLTQLGSACCHSAISDCCLGSPVSSEFVAFTPLAEMR